MSEQNNRVAQQPPSAGNSAARRPLPADLVPRIAPPLSPASPKPTVATPQREAPARPGLVSRNSPPVLVKVPPPLSVRLSQLLWVLSFAVGGFTIVYFVLIREELLPLIAEVAKGVAEDRSEEVYTSAANIVFWWVFAVVIATMLLQVAFLISFMNRRRGIRWWQLITFAVLVLVLLVSPEWVALGQSGESLQLLFATQVGLVLLALLFSVFPGALAWSARKHDIRRGPIGPGNSDF